MDNMKTKNIVVQSNGRKDFGNLEELKASIKEHGILEPLLVTPKGFLIAGERRLRAAIALKLDVVPVRIIETEDEHQTAEVQLVENLQRKDLNPVEEGYSFKKYIGAAGTDAEMLAKKIGRKADYVKRRIILTEASADVKNALIKGSIELGHAAVLARIPDKKRQKECLKEIIDDAVPVRDLNDVFGYGETCNKDLARAPFDKKECKDCVSNGGEQMLLLEIGDQLKGECLNAACYVKKVKEWVAKQTELLTKKGINVVKQENLKNFPKAYHISAYDKKVYDKAVDQLEKKPEEFAVVFYQESNADYPEKRVYGLIAPEKKKTAEDKLELGSQEVENKRAGEYKTTFIREASKILLKPGDVARAIIAHKFLEKYHNFDEDDVAWKALHLKDNDSEEEYVEKIMSASAYELDVCLAEFAKDHLDTLSGDELDIISKTIGFKMEESFEMTEEFLNLHTVSQLKTMALELGMTTSSSKKAEVIAGMIEQWKPGMIPKSLQ